MPRKKGPRSLRAVSLQNICENFELICYGMTWSHPEWREVLKTGRYLTVTSPLKALPGHVLNELCEVVLDDLGSAPHILHAVIQPQLTRIKLPPTLRTVPLAVKLIVERTHKLSSFELTSCRSVNPLVVAAVVPYLSNLTHLNVEGTQFDDFGVSQLGSWVTGLLTLNIARTRVSEAGLALLEDKLQDLTFCIILGNTTRVSPPSVLRFLMSHTALLTLEYENIREVLYILSEQENPHNMCSLRKIILENCRSDFDKVLENCINFFPLLEALSFNNCDLDLVMLAPITQCAHLSKLELGNSVSTQYTVSLVETVLPVLNIIGSQLSHLSLENFKFFDVTTIGRLCPKLISLKLSNILSYCRAENQKISAFTNLEELCIFNTRLGNITEGMLRQLLGSSKLKTINFQFVSSLSDKLFNEILRYNSFPSLEFVTLDQCHRIGPELCLDLLKIPPNLQSLHCWSCSNITAATQQQIQNFIEQSNLDVHFQWSGFQEEDIANDILNEEDDLQNLLLPLININVLPNAE